MQEMQSSEYFPTDINIFLEYFFKSCNYKLVEQFTSRA